MLDRYLYQHYLKILTRLCVTPDKCGDTDTPAAEIQQNITSKTTALF